MQKYSKFYTSLVAAFASAIAVTADQEFSLNDGVVIAAAFLGAIGVYYFPNKD